MREVMFNFFNLHGVSSDDASVRPLFGIVTLRIDKIIIGAIEEGTTFDEYYSHCVSHEVIHQILFDEYGYKTTTGFDWFCYRKYRQFKYWVGGVGGEPEWL